MKKIFCNLKLAAAAFMLLTMAAMVGAQEEVLLCGDAQNLSLVADCAEGFVEDFEEQMLPNRDVNADAQSVHCIVALQNAVTSVGELRFRIADETKRLVKQFALDAARVSEQDFIPLARASAREHEFRQRIEIGCGDMRRDVA